MSKVTIYTPSDFACPYCLRAKALLKQRGVDYQEIQLSSEDDAKWDELYKKSGMKTVPQIFKGGDLIGGFTELAALDQKDQLSSLR
jgi:glutaredoxin 3